jgi:hypothetical protein
MIGAGERFAPVVVSTLAVALALLGAISIELELAVAAVTLAYVCGAAREAHRHAEATRRRAIADVERFIAFGHRTLIEGDLDDDARAHLERHLTVAHRALEVYESAPRGFPTRRRMRAAARSVAELGEAIDAIVDDEREER